MSMINGLRRLGGVFSGPRRQALLAALLVAGVLLAVMAALLPAYEASSLEQAREQARGRLAAYDKALSSALNRRLVILEGLRAFVEGELSTHTGDLAQDEFEQVAAGLYETTTGLEEIWIAPGGILSYSYPPGGTGAGLDLLRSLPAERANELAEAIRSRRIVTGPAELRAGRLTMEGRLAVFYRSQFWGIVMVAVDLGDVFVEAGLAADMGDYRFALQDASQQLLIGDPQVFARQAVTQVISYPSGTWTLGMVPVQGWAAATPQVNLVRFLGWMILGMLSVVVYLITNRQTRLGQAVAQRTQELDRELAERRRAEEELRDSEEKYRTLVETAPDAVLLQDQEGRLVSCNSAACSVFGYEKDALTLLKMADLLPEAVAHLLAGQAGAVSQVLTGGAFIETRYRRKNGQEFPAEVNSNRVSMAGRQFVISYIRDITRRKETEELARDSQERYRRLVDTSPDAIALLDLEGNILLANRKAAQLYEYPSSEKMAGVNIHNLVVAEDRSRSRETLQALGEGIPYHSEQYTSLGRDGRRFPSEMSISANLDARGRITGFTGIVRDVSERTQARREQAALVAAASALRTAVSLEGISENILTQLPGLLEAEGAALFVALPGGENLCVGGVVRWEQWSGVRLARSEGLTGWVVSSGQPFVNNDILRYPQTARLELTGGLNAVAGAPLIAQERTIGALWVGRSQAFREGELRVLMVMADMVASAIHRASIAGDNSLLLQDLQRTNQELVLAYDRTLEGWARALELRDKETEDHTRRVTDLTVKMARALEMSEDELIQVRRGALLHDIGKLGIPDRILLKEGPLLEDEWRVMRLHPAYARSLMEPIPYLRPALVIPYMHHEHWDGSGYPQGLSGERIPLAARIFTVIDVWDALTSRRVYRAAWKAEQARDYLRQNAGVLFDPRIVEAFFRIGGDK